MLSKNYRNDFKESAEQARLRAETTLERLGHEVEAKVAALAEAQHVKVIPHNPLSPVSTAACVQLDACIPNFALQEYTGESELPKSALLQYPLQLQDGYLVIPEGPGRVSATGSASSGSRVDAYQPIPRSANTFQISAASSPVRSTRSACSST